MSKITSHAVVIGNALAALDAERPNLDHSGLYELLATLTDIESEVSRLADQIAEEQMSSSS